MSNEQWAQEVRAELIGPAKDLMRLRTRGTSGRILVERETTIRWVGDDGRQFMLVLNSFKARELAVMLLGGKL